MTVWTESILQQGITHILQAEPCLKPIIDETDFSALLPKTCSSIFAALTRSIVYQQLSGASATAIWKRFLSLCNPDGDPWTLKPEHISAHDEDELRKIGLSTRKAGYISRLAEKFADGELVEGDLLAMSQSDLKAALIKSPGVGPWTCDMVAMFTLGKPDVLPVGDLEIRKGVKKLYQLDELPTPREMERLTRHWQPYRSLGTYCLFVIGRK